MRLSIIAIAALTCLVSSCSRDTDDADGTQHREHTGKRLISIRSPHTPFTGLLPVYVAEEQGMLEANGLAVRWIDVRDPGQGAKLVAAGKADLILSTFANLIPIEARRPGTLRFLFPTSETSADPGSYVLVRPDSPVRTLGDLRGRTLGTYSGPSQKAYALIVLERLSIDLVFASITRLQIVESAAMQGPDEP